MTGGTVKSLGYGLMVDGGKLNATGGKITTSATYASLCIRNTGTATCKSVTIENTVGGTAVENNRAYGYCIIRNGSTNYGMKGKIIGNVIATTNTGAGQASEDVTIYNTGKQYLLFPTWSARVVNGKEQDYIIWTRSNSANGTHTITVKKLDHKNDTGTYYVHIYAANSNDETQGSVIVGITLTF